MSSTQISAAATSPPKPVRPTANFLPTIWGNQFLKDDSEFKKIDPKTQEEYEKLKEEVRRMIMDNTDHTSLQKLNLIDTTQKVCVAYNFEEEIEDALQKIYKDCDIDHYNDLHTVSVYFRLLRQQGIMVSCDVFKKFKDENGKFKSSLINDVQGMLNLYEAAQFTIPGEDILDEALAFTTTQLKSLASCVSPEAAEEINHALKCPIRKSVPKLEARFFMSIYPRDEPHNKTLLKFAKLDYNLLQVRHQKQLNEILRWWKTTGFTKELPYIRDRIVEEYFWVLGMYNYEPKYAYGIRKLTEVFSMQILLDDTFDSYGTLEELTLFTEAIRRWDIDAIDTLPDYMKFIYKTLFDILGAIEEDMTREGRPYGISYTKKLVQRVIEAYYTEAVWFNKGYVPTFKEYMDVALETASCRLIISIPFIALCATEEDFEWLCSDQKIITAVDIISRLLDDKASHRFEQKRGHVPSAVECYMKQHGVSEDEAIRVILEQVADAWKDLNEAMLKPTPISMPLLERIHHYVCTMEFMYKDDLDIDAFSDSSKIKDQVASVLRDPII
ncbi:(E)-beta-farnesene synthase-like [Mangifera indica]|uniref:(E)-beta-farnesene synthase-like n=1 Tax=Mangifera indica TaxID=29780 RepID=UPI001CFB4E6F|nr:(E)-beta-farnesene synthase-like [Mangifera indica]